ncbi:hypothetical protein Q5427_11100 [Brochothrix thermosphacta]|uniref:hypothetical protein n=1 Tax=Brochothrix thermosphacta TaxID=2756 RepID=UPI00271243EC|nr:hypothetical protein [Brochothrix thermosphacta]MDO7864836.1 hypothetical protein [Brochothrix thermosphacta]
MRELEISITAEQDGGCYECGAGGSSWEELQVFENGKLLIQDDSDYYGKYGDVFSCLMELIDFSQFNVKKSNLSEVATYYEHLFSDAFREKEATIEYTVKDFNEEVRLHSKNFDVKLSLIERNDFEKSYIHLDDSIKKLNVFFNPLGINFSWEGSV